MEINSYTMTLLLVAAAFIGTLLNKFYNDLRLKKAKICPLCLKKLNGDEKCQ
jgi:hypothetical protein